MKKNETMANLSALDAAHKQLRVTKEAARRAEAAATKAREAESQAEREYRAARDAALKAYPEAHGV